MFCANTIKLLKDLPGKIGFYYKNLNTGESCGLNDRESFLAASVIKIPILIEVFNQVEKRLLSLDETITLRPKDKVPPCGVLTYLHNGLEATIKDLCILMTIISDNTATNMLINRIGLENVNRLLDELGMPITRLNRLLFDTKAKAAGRENFFSPREIGLLLEKMYKGELVSPKASQQMLDILREQQMNQKIPYLLPANIPIAHKTGEDDGITHDVGIVFAKNPFVICFAANGTDVRKAEKALREIALLCYIHCSEND